MNKTHDYTEGSWGHDIVIHSVIDKGQKLRTSGWGRGIKPGDYLILKNGNSTTRYKVDIIEYKPNPADMWYAELKFAPRTMVVENDS